MTYFSVRPARSQQCITAAEFSLIRNNWRRKKGLSSSWSLFYPSTFVSARNTFNSRYDTSDHRIAGPVISHNAKEAKWCCKSRRGSPLVYRSCSYTKFSCSTDVFGSKPLPTVKRMSSWFFGSNDAYSDFEGDTVSHCTRRKRGIWWEELATLDTRWATNQPYLDRANHF